MTKKTMVVSFLVLGVGILTFRDVVSQQRNPSQPAGPQLTPTQPAKPPVQIKPSRQAIPRTPNLRFPPPTPSNSSIPDCHLLPTRFPGDDLLPGGDLQFGPSTGRPADEGVMCFQDIYGAGGSISNWMMVDGFFANYSETPIPDGMGIHVRVLPGGPGDDTTPEALFYQRSYDICERSVALDRPRSNWPPNVYDIHQRFNIGVNSGRASIFPVRELVITLDPDDAIAEDNESNNMIHCESFYHPDPGTNQCLTGAQVRNGYSGPCPVRSMEWSGSERAEY